VTRWLFAPHALTGGGWARGVRFAVDAGRVVALEGSPAAGVAPRPGDVRLGGVVLPGLSNAHSHSFQRAIAGRTERRVAGANHFWSWREQMYAAALRCSPEDVGRAAAAVARECRAAGYTTLCEFHYLHHAPDGGRYDDPAELSRRVIDAARAEGLSVTHLPVLYRWSGFGGRAPLEEQRRFVCGLDEYARLVERLRALYAGDPQVRIGLAPHSLRAVSPEDLRALVDLWRALGPAETPVHVHIAEQRAEVEGCLEALGARPVEWLLAHAPVDARWTLVHATHMTAAERAALGRSGAAVCVCPTTEANLGDGLFAAPEWLEEGGALAVGSDSNVSVSAAEELRLLEYGQRLTRERRNVCPPLREGEREAWTGATLWRLAALGGAQASGRPAALRVGDAADFVVLDGEEARAWGLSAEEQVEAWVFGGRGGVAEVWVGGARLGAR